MRVLPSLLTVLLVFSCEQKQLEIVQDENEEPPVNYEFIGVDVSEGIPHGMEAGEKAPLFEAVDYRGEVFSLEEALSRNSVLLIFAQGIWNPHLLRMFYHLNDTVPDMEEAGVLPVVITSMSDSFVQVFARNMDMQYITIVDTANLIAALYNGEYTSTSDFVDRMLLEENFKLNAGKDGCAKLPLTAVYLVGQTGEISWAHKAIDPAYRPMFNFILENINGEHQLKHETAR